MPILSDALMDAGCADKEIIAHCRAETGHVRGCWVLDLILDKQWETVWSDAKPAAKKKPKAPSAKAPSGFILKPAMAREIDELMESQAKWSAVESIAREYAENRKHRKTGVRNTMQYLGYSAEQAEADFAFNCLSSQGNWRERGVARRIRLDDPRELAEHVCIEARAEWMAYGNDDEDPAQRLNQLVPAVAVHDEVLEKRILETSPYPLKRGHPDDICFYNAVFAVLKGDLAAFRRLFPYTPRRKTNRYWNAGLQCLQAAAQNKPDEFRKSLEECLDIQRRTIGLLGLFDVHAHGLYEICRRAAPTVVATFDVNHPPPWDAALHRWLKDRDDPLKELNWKTIPEEIRDGLRKMTRPVWWDTSRS
jgi:hypothetical protein